MDCMGLHIHKIMQTIHVTNNKEKQEELIKTGVYRRIDTDTMAEMMLGEISYTPELELYLLDMGEVLLIENYNLVVDSDYPVDKLQTGITTYKREVEIIHD